MSAEGLDIRAAIGHEEHERRMSIARRFARWHIGSESWADEIIGAYFSPDAAAEALDAEQEATP